MLNSTGIQPGWGSQWESLANAINDYYGGGVEGAQYQQVISMLNSGDYTMEEMESILGNIPEFNRTYNAQGQLTGVSYTASTNTMSSAAGSVAQEINSNVANSTKSQFSTVQTITKDSQTGKVTISDDVVRYKTGQLAPTTAKSVVGSSIIALAAAGTGIKLGKAIDSTLYNLAPDFWDDMNMSSLNPETWSSITAGDNGFGAKLFNWVFCIDEDTNNPEPYIDETTLAYIVAYMGSQGVFNGNVHGEIPEDNPFPEYVGDVKFSAGTYTQHTPSNDYTKTYGVPVASWEDGYIATSKVTYPQTIYGGNNELFIYDNRPVYYSTWKAPYEDYYITPALNNGKETPEYTSDACKYTAWLMEYGDYGRTGVEGITSQDGATQFDPSNISDWSDISSVLNQLKSQYPELWENRIETSPNGDSVITYVPIGFPTGGVGSQPTTDGASQSDPYVDISGQGANATDVLIKTLIDMLQQPKTQTGMEDDTDTPTKPVDPNGDPRGTGDTPPIIPPIGSASALWKIYNPSQSQLDTFGAWLWSSNFVDQLLKLFNDPMQAIIGLHKVYCNPPISGSGPIKVGYLVSDASANYVSHQYTEIDCGTVNMKEHFNNVFDYDGFTRISIFLPFIGFRELDTKDVTRGKINVKYGIDVLTGACLAKISVTRDLNSPLLYTFEGNCAVQYPVSSGSYIGIITGLCALIGGVAGTIASGGALGGIAPALVGATAGLPRMHANVEHSGSISANAGALGPKKPYIVIQRPQTHMPLNGILIEGEGQNESAVLGSLSGFVRVKKADLNGIPGTSNELNELRELLENGIYMA